MAAASARADEIYAALRSAGGDADVVVLHSALVPLGLRPERLKDDFLTALLRLVDDGTTLALLSFTFSFCAIGWYHERLSRPETGTLSEWLFGSGTAVRTRHPVYSFLVAGPLTDRLLDTSDRDAFGPRTIFERFDDLHARIVMAGNSWQWCTQVHRYEEVAGVPYRHHMYFGGIAKYGAGWEAACPRLCVRDSLLDSTLNFSVLFRQLSGAGAIAATPLGRGSVQGIATDVLRERCLALLERDPFILLDRPREIERRLAERGYVGSVAPPRVRADNTDWTLEPSLGA